MADGSGSVDEMSSNKSSPSKKPKRLQSAYLDEKRGKWRCRNCGWIYPVANPDRRQRRDHKKHCEETLKVQQWLTVFRRRVRVEHEEMESRDDYNARETSTSPKTLDTAAERPLVRPDDYGRVSEHSTSRHETENQSERGTEDETKDETAQVVGSDGGGDEREPSKKKETGIEDVGDVIIEAMNLLKTEDETAKVLGSDGRGDVREPSEETETGIPDVEDVISIQWKGVHLGKATDGASQVVASSEEDQEGQSSKEVRKETDIQELEDMIPERGQDVDLAVTRVEAPQVVGSDREAQDGQSSEEARTRVERLEVENVTREDHKSPDYRGETQFIEHEIESEDENHDVLEDKDARNLLPADGLDKTETSGGTVGNSIRALNEAGQDPTDQLNLSDISELDNDRAIEASKEIQSQHPVDATIGLQRPDGSKALLDDRDIDKTMLQSGVSDDNVGIQTPAAIPLTVRQIERLTSAERNWAYWEEVVRGESMLTEDRQIERLSSAEKNWEHWEEVVRSESMLRKDRISPLLQNTADERSDFVRQLLLSEVETPGFLLDYLKHESAGSKAIEGSDTLGQFEATTSQQVQVFGLAPDEELKRLEDSDQEGNNAVQNMSLTPQQNAGHTKRSLLRFSSAEANWDWEDVMESGSILSNEGRRSLSLEKADDTRLSISGGDQTSQDQFQYLKHESDGSGREDGKEMHSTAVPSRHETGQASSVLAKLSSVESNWDDWDAVTAALRKKDNKPVQSLLPKNQEIDIAASDREDGEEMHITTVPTHHERGQASKFLATLSSAERNWEDWETVAASYLKKRKEDEEVEPEEVVEHQTGTETAAESTFDDSTGKGKTDEVLKPEGIVKHHTGIEGFAGSAEIGAGVSSRHVLEKTDAVFRSPEHRTWFGAALVAGRSAQETVVEASSFSFGDGYFRTAKVVEYPDKLHTAEQPSAKMPDGTLVPMPLGPRSSRAEGFVNRATVQSHHHRNWEDLTRAECMPIDDGESSTVRKLGVAGGSPSFRSMERRGAWNSEITDDDETPRFTGRAMKGKLGLGDITSGRPSAVVAPPSHHDCKGHGREVLQQARPSSPSLVKYDVERVLREQTNYDLMCPICGSVITRQIITRKKIRKFTRQDGGVAPAALPSSTEVGPEDGEKNGGVLLPPQTPSEICEEEFEWKYGRGCTGWLDYLFRA